MLNVSVPARRCAKLIMLPLLLVAMILMSLPAPAFAQPAAPGAKRTWCCPTWRRPPFSAEPMAARC